jgi:hypothetical protein
MHFSLNRIKAHLSRHFRKHGREGYIVLADYSDYFANIVHDILLDLCYRAFGEDERLYWLAVIFVKAFLKGLGLGSEISQIGAVA